MLQTKTPEKAHVNMASQHMSIWGPEQFLVEGPMT